ncbi:TRAP transporter small permease [uncultured Ilyobacter sp.]|uniref:TRAP transporter small permease n=1 Tax=uncultured Ilyobacter sp. TaxID=544433 RepID=UPI0029F556D6|nr:TRAP transporter small permease [uncultured Ilyobacter sp.]
MNFIKKVNNFTRKIEEVILSYGIIFMAITLIGNVISRTLFNKSWTWAEEVGQILVIAITFVGTSHAARVGRHIRMSAFFDTLSQKNQKILILIMSLITSITMFYLSYLSLLYTVKIYSIGRVTPSMRLPMYKITSVVVFGFFLSGIQYLINFILNIKEKDVYIGTEKKIGDEELISGY